MRVLQLVFDKLRIVATTGICSIKPLSERDVCAVSLGMRYRIGARAHVPSDIVMCMCAYMAANLSGSAMGCSAAWSTSQMCCSHTKVDIK